VLLGLLPLLGLGVLLAFIVLNGAGVGREDAPPVEDLNVERVALPTRYEFVLSVRNGGPEPVTLRQVVVNDAIWDFEAEPGGKIPRLGSATVTVPYSWVEGEAYEIVLLTSTGPTFDAEVPVAVLTPQFSGGTFLRYALIGTYVGVIPVALGLMWYPVLRRLGSSGIDFVLALTVGLLACLAIDTLEEAMEVAVELPGVFSGIPLVILLTLLTLLGLLGTERRLLRRGREETSRLVTSYRIALGIGLHNLGEGLAIGAAFALGEAALGVFLVVGFTLHNITEGVGIAAPILKERPRLVHFLWLALLGGGPAIAGTWIGGFAFSNLLAAVFLAVGAGAILQVIYEVTRLLYKDSARSKTPALSAPNLGGFVCGVAIMYATALLVSV